MKRIFLLTLFSFFGITFSYSQKNGQSHSNSIHQGMTEAVRNYASFSSPKERIITQELKDLTPVAFQSHPDFGVLPDNAPPENCIELLNYRTANSRYYTITGTNGKEFFVQKGYGNINYQDKNGYWRAQNSKLSPEEGRPGVFSAKDQESPIKIDTKNKNVTVTNRNYELVYNKDLSLYNQKADGTLSLLAKANWSDISVGDDGAIIKNIFPDIDLQINVFTGKLKTNFTINKNPGLSEGLLIIQDAIELPSGLSYSSETAQPDNKNIYNGAVSIVDSKNEKIFDIGEAYGFDNSGNRAAKQAFSYEVSDKKLNILVPLSWLNSVSRVFPVTIDPLVTSSGTKTQATIAGSGKNNTGAWTTGCPYTLAVATPANATITDILWSFTYEAIGTAKSDGALDILLGSCRSPGSAALYWTCNQVTPGQCTGTNISIFSDLSSCLNPPQCAPYNLNFTMNFYDAFSGATCSNVDIAAASDWIMTVQGKTVEIPPAISSSGGTSICGGTSTTLTAASGFGVPSYTYSWSPGTALSTTTGATVVASPMSTITYTVTTTDACGLSATKTITITVNGAGVSAGPDQTVCSGGTVSLAGTISGGATSATWSGGTGTFSPGNTTLNATYTLGVGETSGTVTLTLTTNNPAGSCNPATDQMVITIGAGATANAGIDQSVCRGSTVTLAGNIGGLATSGTWSGGTGTFTPNATTLNATYTPGALENSVTLTLTTNDPAGSCTAASDQMVITINPNATITLTSAAATTTQTVCASTAITNITYSIGGGGTGAGVTGLPAGVTGTFSGGVFTISGTPTATGTFNYTITTTGTCTQTTATGTIIVNPASTITLTSAASTNAQTICLTAPITNITYAIGGSGTGATVTGLPAGVTGSFSGGTFTISGTPTATGTFNYTVSTTGPCSPQATATGTIIINSNATITLTSAASTTSQTVCATAAITNITYSIGGGGTGAGVTGLPAGVTGSFSGGTFTISGTPTVTGTFNYTVTTTGTCTQVTATGSIIVNPNATITLTSAASTTSQTVCATNAITNITYTVAGGGTGAGVTGLPAGVTGSFSGGTFTISGTPTATGTFNYIVTTTGSCTQATATGSIIVNPTQSAAFNYSSSTFCQTGTNPTPNITGTSGGSFTFTPAGLSINGSSGVIDLAASSLNTYNVTYTTAGPCPASSFVSVTISTSPSTGFSYPASPYCQNGVDPSPVFVAGASAGTFTSAAGLAFVNTSTGVINLAASTSGTYSVTNTITASGGCAASSSTSSITISQAPIATFSFTGTPYCQSATNPSPTFSGGGTAGTFTSSAGLIINSGTGVVDLAASTPGTYTVSNSFAASGGCAAVTATSNITIDPDATIALSSAVNTDNQSVCESAAITDITYTVAGGGTGAGVTGLPAGVTGTFSGGTFTVTGTPTATGTFNYTVTTTGTCNQATATGSIIVDQDATITLTSGVGTDNQTVCESAAITNITYTIAGGGTGAGVTGLPAGVTGTFSGGTFTISGTPTVTGTFNYTVTTTGNCIQTSATGTIIVDLNATITLSSAVGTDNQSVCGSTAITDITYTVAGGGTGAGATGLPAGVTGTFSGGTFTISGTPTVTGTFNYTVTTTGTCNQATATGSIIVDQDATITLSSAVGTDNQTVCESTPITAITYSIGGGGTGAGATGLPAGVTGIFSGGTYTVSGTPTVTGTFNYTVTTTGNCNQVSATGTITVNPKPSVTVNSPTICNDGTTASLTASGADTYTWSAGATSTGTNTASAAPTSTTTYTVTGTTAGCTGTAQATVTVKNCDLPEADMQQPIFICEPGTVNFTNLSTNSTSWEWSFPGATPTSSTLQNPQNISYPAYGSYVVTLIAYNANGADTTTGTVTVGPPVEVNITGNLLITTCEETELTANPTDGTYVWSPSATLSSSSGATVTAKPETTQEYQVIYTSPEGCKDTAVTTVVVQDINTYFLPTGFTPNGDGINDEIHLHGRGIDYFTLKIYDRIGEKVFETSDMEKGWNGKLHGLAMNNGVFVYVLDITFCNGENVKKHGDITLVK